MAAARALDQLAAAPSDLRSAVLVDAAARGCIELLHGLLQRMPAGPEEAHKKAFLAAAAAGHAPCLAVMLERPAGRDQLLAAADYFGRNALILAAAHGHLPCLAVLLEHFPEPQVAAATAAYVGNCRVGSTALMVASDGGHHECVALLLRHVPGQQVLAADDKGWNALMWAVSQPSVPCVRLLLQHSQVAAHNGKGESALIQLTVAPYRLLAGEGSASSTLECLSLLLAWPHPRDTCDAALLNVAKAAAAAVRVLDGAAVPAAAEPSRRAIRMLLARGAMLPVDASDPAREAMRSVTQDLAQQVELPRTVNEITKAVVDLALLVRGGP